LSAKTLETELEMDMTSREAPELLISACTRCGGTARYDGKESAYRCMMCARAVLPVEFNMELLDAESTSAAA
jgi:tRNA(Ile2) C34 agmatinyltransferase TiaS